MVPAMEQVAELGYAERPGVQADFSVVDCTHELFVEQIYHQAVVDADEGGTQAAAATAVEQARKGGVAGERDVRVAPSAFS